MRAPTRSLLALAALVAFCAAAQAASLEVVPTVIELPAKGGAAQMRLVNHGDAPVEVQVEGFAWTQDGKETLSDSDDIVLSPPQARLDPHGFQIVRLLVEPGTGAERAFRVIVTQLPDPKSTETGTRVLLQFSVPLFAGDGALPASRIDWSLHRAGGALSLQARNGGTRRAKFSKLELVSAGGERRAVSPQSLVYVLAGAMRSWTIAAAAGDRFHLEGYDDIAGKRLFISLAVSD